MAARGFGRGKGFGGAAGPSAVSLSFSTPPPDLSRIGDPNIVVSFKGLLKKSDTTLVRALEEIRTYVRSMWERKTVTEAAIMEAWTELYPRLAINNARKVRELSHIVHLEMFQSVDKTVVEQHILRMVPTWLAGTFDNDKAVTTAAQKGWDALLLYNEKMSGLLKVSQPAILDYVQEGLDQTPETLSDERTMSPDDLKSTYFRLIGNCINMVTHLIKSLDESHRKKYSGKYEALFGNQQFLKCTSAEDPHLRRSIFQLIAVGVFRQSSLIKPNLKAISRALISDALNSSQLNSAYDLVETLRSLTVKFPEVWTLARKSKIDPLTCLRGFIEKGSQRGRPEFWSSLTILLHVMPEDILPDKVLPMRDFASSIRSGIKSRDEPKSNAQYGWASYMKIVTDMATKQLSDPDSHVSFIEQAVFPAIRNYVLVDTGHSLSVESPTNIKDALKCLSSSKAGKIHDRILVALQTELKSCANELVNRMSTSTPVESLDFEKVEDGVKTMFIRWFMLLEVILNDEGLTSYIARPDQDNSILSITLDLLCECALVTETHQGNSYGAASALSTCVRMGSLLTEDRATLVAVVKAYLESHTFDLITSPSGEYLLGALKALKACPGQYEAFEEIWNAIMEKTLELEPGDQQCLYLATILRHGGGSELALQSELVQSGIERVLHGSVVKSHDHSWWGVFDAAVASKSVSDALATKITIQISLLLLSQEFDAKNRGLHALSTFLDHDEGLLLSSKERKRLLLTPLITLKEHMPEWADPPKKSAIKSFVKLLSDGQGSDHPHESPLIEVIQCQLGSITENPLSIDTLMELATNFVGDIDGEDNAEKIAAVIPTHEMWEQAFSEVNELNPMIQLAVREPLVGAQFLLKGQRHEVNEMSFDEDGFSIPLRIASYARSIMPYMMLKKFPVEQVAEMLYFLCLTEQHLKCQDIAGAKSYMTKAPYDHKEFDKDVWHAIIDIIRSSKDWRRAKVDEKFSENEGTPILRNLVDIMIVKSKGTTALGYYSGVALSKLLDYIVRIQGPKFECTDSWLKDQAAFIATELDNPFLTLAILTGHGTTLRGSNLIGLFCNNFIAAIDSHNIPTDIYHRTLLLVSLNGTLGVYEGYDLPVQPVRLMRLVKTILSWIDGENFWNEKYAIGVVACMVLAKVLPRINDSTGEHWNQVLDKLCLEPLNLYAKTDLAENQSSIAPGNIRSVLCVSSLQLHSNLVKLTETSTSDYLKELLHDYRKSLNTTEEKSTSDYLKDLLDDYQQSLNQCLLGVLKHPLSGSDPVRSILEDILQPEVLKISVDEIDMEDIYPLIGSPTWQVQATAFQLLSKALPRMVEKMTLEVLVDKKGAELPAELLSLLLSGLASPDPDTTYDHDDYDYDTLNANRSVLLAWELILRIFSLAPFRVRVQLEEQLGEIDELKNFLEFVWCTFAGPGGRMRPLSHFQQFKIDDNSLREYNVWTDFADHEGSHNVQWLSAKVYFMALKYFPRSVKSWFLNFSRAGKQSMGEWTEVNFTPLVIEDCVEEVRAWRGPNETKDTDDGKQIMVKLPSKTGTIITVSYEIDDQFCVASLEYPRRYPLDSIEVKSINRVAVTEKQWDSIMKQIQGVLKFTGGNAVDGIEIFRQNVAGFLHGHDPCSICYSIVSEDMKLPEKSCATCKQRFHTKCISKWFTSSNATSCPMCRQPFYGVRKSSGMGGGVEVR